MPQASAFPFIGTAAALASLAVAVFSLRRLSPAPATSCVPYQRSLKKRLLLISNSKLFGLGYLDHAEKHILDFLGPLSASSFVLFVPYAQKDHDAYAQKARERFAEFGVSLRSIHEFTSAAARREGVESAACLFVGGGNSFRLLKSMQSDPALMPLIRSRVLPNLATIQYDARCLPYCGLLKKVHMGGVVRGVLGMCAGVSRFRCHPAGWVQKRTSKDASPLLPAASRPVAERPVAAAAPVTTL